MSMFGWALEQEQERTKETVASTKRVLRAKTTVTVDPSKVGDSSAADYIMAVATAAMRRDQLAPDVLATVKSLVDPVALGWIETWRNAERSSLTIIRDKMLSDLILPQL